MFCEVLIIEKNRIEYIDAIKAICMALVVFTHAHECAGSPLGISSIFYSIDRCAVPIFFMISGYFIIGRAYNCDLMGFYIKRIPKFIYAIFLCSVLTNTIFESTHGMKTKNAFLYALFSENGIFYGNYAHAIQLWFMYPLILIYLMSPFISNIVVGKSKKYIFCFIFISLLFNQIKFSIYSMGYNVDFLNKFGSDFTGGYLCFFILGYVVIGSKKNIGNVYFLSSVFILSLMVFLAHKFDKSSGVINQYLHWYSTSIQVFICSICLYFILKFIFQKVSVKIINDIGKKSFGIYLFHYSIMYLAIFLTKTYDIKWYNKLFLYFFSSFILAYFLTCVLMKIKFLKKIIS